MDMFTGIIEALGTVRGVQSIGTGRRMSIESGFQLGGTKIGDSIAVNGACLTVVSMGQNRFEADLSPETTERTTLGSLRIGDRVNLERALRLSDRLDGHLVSGHVDGIGRIRERITRDNAILVAVDVPPALARYMIRKGSVALDGISLTINEVESGGFSVSVIPHTAKLTTIGFRKPGDAVNIETDLIGKYVERFLVAAGSGAEAPKNRGVDLDLLRSTGFL